MQKWKESDVIDSAATLKQNPTFDGGFLEVRCLTVATWRLFLQLLLQGKPFTWSRAAFTPQETCSAASEARQEEEGESLSPDGAAHLQISAPSRSLSHFLLTLTCRRSRRKMARRRCRDAVFILSQMNGNFQTAAALHTFPDDFSSFSSLFLEQLQPPASSLQRPRQDGHAGHVNRK